MSYGRDGSEGRVKGKVLKGWQSEDRRSKQMEGWRAKGTQREGNGFKRYREEAHKLQRNWKRKVGE